MDPFDLYQGIELELKKDASFLTAVANGKSSFKFQDFIDISIDLNRASFTIESMRKSQYVLSEVSLLEAKSLHCEEED